MKALVIQPSVAPIESYREDNAKPYVALGLMVVLLLFGGLIAWSLTASIGGAVIAPGTVAVESNRKSVEHLEGGIVGALLVREGDRVEAGQILLRLDDTVERASLAVLDDQLVELRARSARLRAELHDERTVDFGPALRARRGEPKVRQLLEAETDLFQARKASRESRRDVLEQRVAGFQDQIAGLGRQQDARSRQIALTEQELVGVEKLHVKGHAPLTRVLELKGRLQQFAALQAEHATDIAIASNSIGETQLRMSGDNQAFLESVSTELRDVQASILNLAERHSAAQARLSRLDISAPQSGIVLGLTAHTIGGVVRPGEPVMEIVPADDALVLEARVQPTDVDKVRAGLRSKIRLSAFDQQTTPEINGTLESISADRLEDPRRGEAYFLARIRIVEDETSKLDGLELVPGMPAEVFIETGERLAISYLLKPLLDNVTRAFKDG